MSQLTTPSNDTHAGGEVIEKDFIRVVFQNGFPKEVGVNGCRVEDVIRLATERLQRFQDGPMACDENAEALSHLKQATKLLEDRIQRRFEQGVLNTMKQHDAHRTEDLDLDFSATGA